MKQLNFVRGVRPLIGALIAVCLLAAPSFAAVYNLRAAPTTVAMPGAAAPIAMWGFADDTIGGAGSGVVTVPGPMLEVLPGDTTLTINLQNDLPVPISLVIPGQAASLSPVSFVDNLGRTRVRSFTTETAAGAAGVYTWNNLKPGTYIYHSGTHPALQVQMGLYGGLKIDAVAGIASTPPEAYLGVPYDNEVILFYSEIDPAMHAAVAGGTYGTPAYPSAYDYKPRYFLINGKPYPDAAPIMDHPLQSGERTLVRFLNMGLRDLVPTILDHYWDIVAEDGNLYPYPQEQYTMLLSAGKTKDAVWVPADAVTYPVFDRRLSLTNAAARDGGMLVKLLVNAGTVAATNDSYTVAEDGVLTVIAPGVLGNDTGTGLTAVLVENVKSGTLVLYSDGSFTYTPNANFSGGDFFTYKATDGTNFSNAATVTLGVTPANDAPTAAADAFEATAGNTLNVAAPGVLGNDSDPDGDVLTAALVTGPTGGDLTLNANGSFTYNPNAGTTEDSFTYQACDPGALCSSPATSVTITVVTPSNIPPTAVDDSSSTPRNTVKFINLVANDSDPDGTIDPNSIVIVTPPTRGGTVQVVTNGVNYTPRKNFRGTDTFTYTVKDNNGATSNVATVRVNVL
jgi:FtsP/CotA-like multicopper oxidase with cupredoxin domain